MIAKTDAQRQKERRERREAAGLTRCEVFAHPEDHPKIKRYAAKLTAARVKGKD